MQNRYKTLQGFTGFLVFLHMISIFAMMVVVGVAISTMGLRAILQSSSEYFSTVGLNAGQSAILDRLLLQPIDKHIETTIWFWQIAIAISGGVMIMFVFWAFAAHRNLSEIGARGVKNNSAVGILYWFIPILNMFLPHIFLREIWHGSDPAGLTMRRKSNEASPRLVGLHWICFILGFSWYPTMVIAALSLDQLGFDSVGWFESQLSGRGWRSIYTWAVVSGMSVVFMNFVGIFLVLQVNQMQSDRNQIFLARSA